jgi:hypothetical protein
MEVAMIARIPRIGLALALGFVIAAGAAGCTDAPPLFGPVTESECPPGSTLTWDNFGRKFMEDYCTRCHHSALRGEARNGATSFHDYDTVSGVRATDKHIDQTTASGPAATNESMPPDGKKPTLEERRQLGEWLACDAPE